MNTTSIVANIYSSGSIPLVLTGTLASIAILLLIITVASHWFIFEKAGKPGWKALIPIYNFYVLLKLIGKPWWFLFFMLIPYVNVVFGIYINYHLAKVFGKDIWFTVGMIVLPFIFYPILAFGDARYTAPIATV